MQLGLGLIGSGFMGRTHAFAFNNVNRAFDLPVTVLPLVVADLGEEQAARAAAALGFPEWVADWRRLVTDPRIHIVSITAPNVLHKEMALAAIAAGKHVYCEKPLAPTVADAEEMTRAAEEKGVVTAIGFNYLKNPMMRLARDIIESGEIGEIRAFSAIHAEDYMMDSEAPWTWRLDPAGGGGALADLGSHVIAAARYLIGPITEVCGETATLVPTRPDAPRSARRMPVEVEDVGRAFLHFQNGCNGVLEANWAAGGRKMRQDFEITGAKGSIAYSGERMNELELYVSSGRPGREGFRKILSGPANEPYGAFCVAPGHQLGFNDLKTIEARDFLRAIAGEETGHADFREGLEVQRTLEAIYRSAASRCWTQVG